MSSARGVRMVRALQNYGRSPLHHHRWDAANVFNKINLDSAGEGNLRAHFTVEASMCNSGDYLHGGFIASLVDTAGLFGYVSHPLGRVAWTTHVDLNFITKAALGERIQVEATPIRIHAAGGLVECVLKNGKGHIIAKGTTSLMAAAPSSQAFIKEVSENLDFDFYDIS